MIDPVVDFGIGLCPRILCDAKIHYWIDNKCLFDSILKKNKSNKHIIKARAKKKH